MEKYMEKIISQLKTHNKLINIVRCQPGISKTALAEYLKVSWPTASATIDNLKRPGFFKPPTFCPLIRILLI